MGSITKEEITEFIEQNVIPEFYRKKTESLSNLQLHRLIKGKNPYLFSIKNINTPQEFITEVLRAYLSSQEETFFGSALEQLAIFICEKVYGGHKAEGLSMDLYFERDSIIYIVSIKSGPNWGNSSQITQMLNHFRTAKRILGTNNPGSRQVIAVNGCCYGRDSRPDKGEYLKLCGQRFWELISGDNDMYTRIIAPLIEETNREEIKRKDREFQDAYAQKVIQLTREFEDEFCTDGKIDWTKLAVFTSSPPIKVAKTSKPKKARSSSKPKGARRPKKRLLQ